MRWLSPSLAALVLALLVPASALGHAERPSYYPNFDPQSRTFGPAFGGVPSYRRGGPKLVVCKPTSRLRIKRSFRGRGRRMRRLRRQRLRLLRQCRFRHIQAAIDAARSGHRILVMPGVYREEPSVAKPVNDPRCEAMKVDTPPDPRHVGVQALSYEGQRECPHSDNLIALTGDGPDADRRCDLKCDLQIEGFGRRPGDVLIVGDVRRVNVIRADRADGIYLRNFTVQYSDGNNVYVHETNGFRLDRIVSRWSKEYSFLSFTSDNGLYENLVAYGAGDSGIYPGSGPEGHCERYGIEVRNVDSYANNLGYSGTAGNGVWVHDSKFHHNGVGMVTDSVVPGHPGMPQDCALWENNEIYSNNMDIFGSERTSQCTEPGSTRTRAYTTRDPRLVCSTFPIPVGTGVVIEGNRNIVRNNHIYDQWRFGAALAYLSPAVRLVDPTGQSETPGMFDVSNGNSFVGNRMGVRPDGVRDPNGRDFLWDGEGQGNCWSANTGPGESAVTSYEDRSLPACPDGSPFSPGDLAFSLGQTTCLTWDSEVYGDYPPCGRPGRPEEEWWTLPAEPR
jgi:hypothetical protein